LLRKGFPLHGAGRPVRCGPCLPEYNIKSISCGKGCGAVGESFPLLSRSTGKPAAPPAIPRCARPHNGMAGVRCGLPRRPARGRLGGNERGLRHRVGPAGETFCCSLPPRYSVHRCRRYPGACPACHRKPHEADRAGAARKNGPTTTAWQRLPGPKAVFLAGFSCRPRRIARSPRPDMAGDCCTHRPRKVALRFC
jgi:hypothetical protein